MKVRIIELADRYILVDAQSGEEIEPDQVGFSYKQSAKEYAEANDWEVLQ